MPESLTTRIAERLDISPDQTDRVLRTLARLIKKQSERDGRVRVPGLGIFEQTNGTLTFEPDRRLAAAVNEQYAALDTVPVAAPSADQPSAPSPSPEEIEETPEAAPSLPAADSEEATETAPSPIAEAEEASATTPPAPVAGEEPVAPPPLPKEPEVPEMPDAEAPDEPPKVAETPGIEAHDEPPPEQEVEQSAKEPADAEPSSAAAEPATEEDALQWAPPGSRWTDDSSAELAPMEASADQAAGHDDEVASSVEPDRPHETPGDLPPTPRKTPYAKRHGTSSKKRRSWLPWVVLVLFLVLAAVAAYVYLDRQDGPLLADETEQMPPEPAPAEEAPADAPPNETDAGGTDADATTAEDTEAPTPEAEDTPPPAPSEQEAPSATGATGIDRATGGYTLIVGSRAEAALAEQSVTRFREQLNDETVPVDVLEGTSDGVTRYRIAIGQVDTIDDALALKERLGDRIPSDAWVMRIPSDTD